MPHRGLRPLLVALVGQLGPGAMGAQQLPPLDEHLVRVFDASAGLLAADVRGLAQTADGYLYVAGARGLTRFDGYDFHAVPLPGLRSRFIQWLYHDRRDRLWLRTAGGQLGVVVRGRFQLLPDPPVPVGDVTETSDGAIWLGGADGLVRVTADAADPYTRFTTAHGLPSDTVAGVYELADGERVVVTVGRLARVESDAGRPAGLRFVPFGPAFRASRSPRGSIRVDEHGLWIALPTGVLRYHAGRVERYEPGTDGAIRGLGRLTRMEGRAAFLASALGWLTPAAGVDPSPHLPWQRIETALRTRDGTRWLSVGEAARDRHLLVRHRDGMTDTLPLRPLLDFQRAQHLLEDHEGSLWVGTDRGLLHLSPRRVRTLGHRQGLAEGFTTAVLESRDGALWVGSWGGGLHRFAGGRLTDRLTAAGGALFDEVRALYEAADGTLWVGGRGGYAALRGGRVVLRETIPEEVRAFAETAGGVLWIGTSRRLLRRDAAGVAEDRPATWRGRSIWALHRARDGALWVGSERGLFRVSRHAVRAFGAADGLRSPFVASIHEEADGTLWFGTYEHGLHRWRGARLAAVTTREGLHHDGVWRMLGDGRGGVWMSSDQGVFRVDHDRLHRVADAVERGERPAARLAPLVFSEAEGMPNRESNRASPGGWRLRDGRLAFNNLAGVVVIDPAWAAAPPPPPRTVLRGVLADGQPPPAGGDGGAPVLAAGTKQLAFAFAALSFLAPEQNRYRYRLDDYDDDWVHAGTQPAARYTHLPAGRYVFRVQGATGTGAWGEPGAAFAFAVRPFPWQTWWFRLLAVLTLAGLLAAAYRYRVGQLLALERLRLRIASDLHDDVGSSLSSIALMSEMLRRRGQRDALDERQLRRISLAAEETIGALRDIIWLVDPKHDGPGHLASRMRGVAADLLDGTAWTFDAPAAATARRLHMTVMRNVLLVHKEALHNVARHARAGRVEIHLAADRDALVLRITDDGIGFAEHAAQPGRGLASMRQRAREVGGRLEIESAPGLGTRLTLQVPLARRGGA